MGLNLQKLKRSRRKLQRWIQTPKNPQRVREKASSEKGSKAKARNKKKKSLSRLVVEKKRNK